MDAETINKLIEVIKTSNDKHVVLKVLAKLRTDLVKDKNGIKLFRLAGGVTPITRFLHKPHEQILEVTLSILGNCCTDEECCREALEAKIMCPLSTILKSIPNQLIQCRACRLLGNLAKYNSEPWSANECVVVAKSLCQILNETNDGHTQLYAFRACRFLLTKSQFFAFFIEANGLVAYLQILEKMMNKGEKLENVSFEAAGLKNNQHREKYFQEVIRSLEVVRSDIFDCEMSKITPRKTTVYGVPEKSEIVEEILKGLLVMSFYFYECKLKVWQILHHNKCTLEPVVQLFSNNRHRTQALRICSNCTKNKYSFYILTSADTTAAACNLLTAANLEQPITDNERRYCLNIIVFLSTDALNRLKIRCADALQKLLIILKDTTNQTEKISVLNILSCFEYDNLSLDLMFSKGLVQLLIRELSICLNNISDDQRTKKEGKQHLVKKRKLNVTDNNSKCKYIKTQDESVVDFDSPSSSPRSYTSTSSPCSSRSMSPVGSIYNKTEAVLDDDTSYSPICSDDDGEGDEEETNQVKNQNTTEIINAFDYSEIMKLLDISSRTETNEDIVFENEELDDDESQEVNPSKLSSQHDTHNCIDIIEKLLLKATTSLKKTVDLAKPETMFTLIKAVRVFGGNHSFGTALTNIILETRFFVHVIQMGLIYEIHKLIKTEELRKDGLNFFETLTCVGESNYGKSELARLLKFDEEKSRVRAAIAVGYIIRSTRLLHTFLNEGQAFKILYDMILNGNDAELTIEAADSLTYMCINSLNIVPNSIKINEYEQLSIESEHICLEYDMVFEVLLEQDNLKVQVPFNKKLLCDASDVFNSMLSNNFREGNENKICMTTCSVNGLKYFLSLIVRQSQQQNTYIPVKNYLLILEAFEMSRMYIMTEMENELHKLLIGLLDETNCLTLFEWSLKNYHTTLTEQVVNFYLCSSVAIQTKVNIFREANKSTYNMEWNQMISDTIFDQF